MAKTDFSERSPSDKPIDEYISTFPEAVQEVLQKIRQTIQEAVPDATEIISYQMPAFRFHGMLVWYAAWKKHIGFYPRTSAMEDHFKDELSEYESSKGTLKFPLNKPIPYDLISRISKFRAEENLKKQKKKPS